jgi:hypothetical protein
MGAFELSSLAHESEEYKQFLLIIDQAVAVLRQSDKRIQESLETNRRLEREFEHQVLLVLQGLSHNSPFSFSAMPSEHSFPDIIAEHTSGVCFGIEIKTSRTWQTNGNSINASITDSRIETIVVVFCKTTPPIEFDYKPYEDAIVSIQVTHFPRYVLNMKAGESVGILRHLNMPYAEFKNLPIKEKVQLLKRYYEEKGTSENKWWIY